ncbi:MAG: hypothetical protein LBR35_02575, partial [Rickettsiales bacterium]|nr:hypothetical protein [Rickettsiales bacterium]
QNNQDAGNFYCWEVVYLIRHNSNISINEYETLMQETTEKYFPNDNQSISYARQLGDPDDIIALALYSNVKDEKNKNISYAMNKTQRFVSSKDIRVSNNGVYMENNTCMQSDALRRSNAYLPKLKKMSYIEDYNLKTMVGKNMGGIMFKNPLQNQKNPYKEITFTIGNYQQNLNWNSKCDSFDLLTINGVIEAITSAKIIISVFKTLTIITDRTYDFMIDLAFLLLPIFLVLWISFQVLKSFNILSVIENKQQDLNVKSLRENLFEMTIYSAVFFAFFKLLTPTDIVNYIFSPILNIGLFVGDKILSVSGFTIPVDFLSNEPQTLMFENTTAYISTYLASIGKMNGQMVSMGINMVLSGRLFVGAGLIYIFISITWRYVKWILSMLFDIIIAISFLPFFGISFIFPKTRGFAKSRTIDIFIDIAYKLAVLPIFLLVNTLIIKVFFTKDLSSEELSVIQQLNDAEVFASIGKDIGIIEVIFVGLIISWFFNECEKILFEMFKAKPEDKLIPMLKVTKESLEKRLKEGKKTVQETVKINKETARIKTLRERLRSRRGGGTP